MSRTENAINNTVFGLFQKLTQTLLPFVMRTIMLHTLGIDYLGLNSLFTSIIQTLSIAELGIAGAITFSMYEPIAKKNDAKVCALLRLYRVLYGLIGLAILLMGVVLLPFLPRLISGKVPEGINIYILYLMHLTSTAMSYSLFSYRSSLLEAHQRNDVISKVNIVTIWLQFVLQVLFLLLFRNYYLYIITQFAMQLVNQITVYWCSRRLFPNLSPRGRMDKEGVAVIVRKVKGLVTSRVGGIVLNTSDTIVISMFLGLNALAIYQNYFFIVSAVCGLISTFLSGALAGVGNSIVTDTKEKNYQDFKRLTFMFAGIVCICTNCFLVLYQPFMKLWMGADKMLPMSMVILFCVYFVLYEYGQLFGLYKNGAGLWYEDRFRPLVTAMANLTLNLLLVRYIGLYGILASTVISMLLIGMPWLLHNLFSTLFHMSVMDYLKEIGKYLLLILVTCVISYTITWYLDLEGVLGLIAYGAVAVCVPCCLYILVFRRSAYFEDTMNILKRLVKKGAQP